MFFYIGLKKEELTCNVHTRYKSCHDKLSDPGKQQIEH